MGRDQLRTGAFTWLGGFALVVSIVLVGGATAAPDRGVFARQVVVDIEGDQGTKGRGVARCPRGARAISGGWHMTDPEETGLVTIASRRVGTRRWAVGAIQWTSDSFFTHLGPTVYCERGAKRSRPVSATGSVPSGETGRVDATCPKGRKAVAGGFKVPTTSDLSRGGLPIVSRRVGRRTWRAVVYAPTPEGASVTAYAYCARRPGKLRTFVAGKPTRDVGRRTQVRSGRCPKRIGARAGGFAIKDRTAPLFSIPAIRIDRGVWEVAARNLGGPSTRLRALAYCH
ncbi:MAG TPA: hypothetical protein VK919_03595 [Solirubrobacterales bacterium]|nr:hypothetical protein [Solirubrobacterales bacterium]